MPLTDLATEALGLELDIEAYLHRAGVAYEILSRIQRQGICRSEVVALESVLPEITQGVPVMSYTANLSDTNLDVACEGILENIWKGFLMVLTKIVEQIGKLLKLIRSIFVGTRVNESEVETSKAQKEVQRTERQTPPPTVVFQATVYEGIAKSLGEQYVETHYRSLPREDAVFSVAETLLGQTEQVVLSSKTLGNLLLDYSNGVKALDFAEWTRTAKDHYDGYMGVVGNLDMDNLYSSLEAFAEQQHLSITTPLTDEVDVTVKGNANRHTPISSSIRRRSAIVKALTLEDRRSPPDPGEIKAAIWHGYLSTIGLSDTVTRLLETQNRFDADYTFLTKTLLVNLQRSHVSANAVDDYRNMVEGYVGQLKGTYRLLSVLAAFSYTHATIAGFKTNVAKGYRTATH